MARSMTGYGRAQGVLHGRDITVEIKSVNSRYFEYSSRLPRSFSFLDDALKKALGAAVGRGKVEMNLQVQAVEEVDSEVLPNKALARGYYEALSAICTDLHIPNDVSARVMVRLPDIFVLRRSAMDEDVAAADVLAVAGQAIDRYNQMREAEGEKLAADVNARLDALEEMVRAVEAGSAERVQKYTQRLYDKLKELLGDRNIEDARVLMEAALFADKTAVDEETVRLRSHLAQYREILAGGGQLGRKLDFLTQEVNREVNTIGSKCQELEITRLVVEMKSEVEKIREQIQNLE